MLFFFSLSNNETLKALRWKVKDKVKEKSSKKEDIAEVPPRFELGSLDSKSRVLTITPWDPM